MNRLYLRLATKADMDKIYNWANEKEVRKNSFNSKPIPYEDHIRWYNNLLDDTETNIQLILMSFNSPIGQCRLKVDGSEAEIGYSIDKLCRGKHFGSSMLSLLSEWVKENRNDISTIVARVKPDNISSIKAFENVGYIRREPTENNGYEYVELAYKL